MGTVSLTMTGCGTGTGTGCETWTGTGWATGTWNTKCQNLLVIEKWEITFYYRKLYI